MEGDYDSITLEGFCLCGEKKLKKKEWIMKKESDLNNSYTTHSFKNRAELQFDCLTTELQSFRSTHTGKNLTELRM